MMRQLVSGSWIRQIDHPVLRIASVACSFFSAYAIHLFFAPLVADDVNEKYLTWVVALAFGAMGYVVPRGLVHRMMLRERVWAYLPICLLVEFVDIACNYVLAAAVIYRDGLLASVPASQQGVLTVITYAVLSVIPLGSIFLAVVDMDMERSKQGSGMQVKKPVLQPVAQRASQQAGAGQGAANQAAARRAQFFANQQKAQQGQASGQTNGPAAARNLLDDPDKTPVFAGV